VAEVVLTFWFRSTEEEHTMAKYKVRGIGMLFSFLNPPFPYRNVLGVMFLTLTGIAAAWAQATVQLVVKPGDDIGAEVNAAIASLPSKTGTVQLPAGSYIQSKTISVTGTGIHIVGAGPGTVLNYNPSNYHLIDSADSSAGWHGSRASVSVLSSIGEDHPDPMQGDGYIQVTTGPGSGQEVSKSIPRTNFESATQIGVWVTLNLTNAQQPIEFFVSDGSRTAYWKVTPPSIYGSWEFLGLDRANPSGNDGGLPDMKNITVIGFRKLIPNAKYYFDAVSLYNPAGPSIVFSSCVQCSLENVTIRWEPDSDSVVRAAQNTRDLLLDRVRTTGGATGIDFSGPSSGSTCKACAVERAHNGFSINGNTSGNQLLNAEATRNVNGIYLGPGATHNTISSPRCVRNNASGILVQGDDNQIKNPDIDTWMTFGLVINGGSHNSVTGVTARSAVGESAVQLIGGAAYNNLSNINIEQSGGSGLDLGGGAKPQVYNTATNVVVHYSGSSSWHGGPKGSSEGRGLCLCNANDNTITHLEIYEAAQRSNIPGAEGIIINNGSSRNKLEDVLIYHSRHEGITVWDASDNTLRNVRVVGNGLKEGTGAGVRIEAPAKNTVLENVCYWMNGGGGIKNVSTSSSVRNTRQVKDMDPKVQCQ
jgi:parallel beta-helix repeat protein